MDYKYKQDWQNAKKMFEAYWFQENDNRCLLNLKAVRNKEVHDPKWGSVDSNISLEERWLNSDMILDRYIEYFENTYFAAEALPTINVNLGPGVTAAYLGCNYNLEKNTIWYEPFINTWGKDEIKFDDNSFMWKKTLEITQKAAELGKGNFFVNQTDLSGILDIMAHLRGTENLLYDLMDYPDEVKLGRDKILEIWFSNLNTLYQIIKQGNDGGSISWLDVWSPGLCHALQCDFAAMISPKQFEEFVMPELTRQCAEMPYSIFHLDGPGMVSHLDYLLEMKDLNAIQWQPGAGQRRPVEWKELLKKIQAKGKSIHTWGSCQDVMDMLDYLSPKGLYVEVTETLKSPQEAEVFIKEVEKKCRKQQ